MLDWSEPAASTRQLPPALAVAPLSSPEATGLGTIDRHGGVHTHAGVSGSLMASQEGLRTLRRSLVILGATGLLQLAVVVLSGSVALLADTVHNVGDALTALPLAAAFLLSRRPATARLTYGYGRSEDLAGLAQFRVAVRLCVDGYSEPPFVGSTRPPAPDLGAEHAAELTAAALERWGRPRAEVEAEILARYRLRQRVDEEDDQWP